MSKENEKLGAISTVLLTAMNKVRQELGLKLSDINEEGAEPAETKMEKIKIQDGAVTLEADSFEVGSEVFVVSEDGDKTPLPVGEYETDKYGLIVVQEEGIIAQVGSSESEEEPSEEEVEAQEMSEADEKPESKEPKKVVETSTTEVHFTAEQTQAIEAMLNSHTENLFERLVAEFKNAGETVEEIELSKEVKTTKHSLSKEVNNVNEPLNLEGMKTKDKFYAVLAKAKSKSNK